MPYTTFEINPQDTGYVVQTVHNDDGTVTTTMIGLGDQPVGSPPVNYAALVTKARAALTNNQTFLAIGNPTTAQAVTQVQALTRQTDALIYFLLHALTGLNSTPGV